MSASPEQMANYYGDDYPQPPEEPQGDPSSEEYQAAMAQYNEDVAAFEAAKAEYEEDFGAPPTPAPVSPPAPPGGGAGQPAARLGDMTAHGGAITVGHPTTIIGGQPAARVADMHNCPMVTGVVPHVGGPIVPPGAPTVIIGGMPAARVGDQATCTGPPDVIAKGDVTVFIG